MLKQKLPNFFEMCPKSSQRSLPKLKCVSFQNSPKAAKHLGLFGKIFFAKTFQTGPNWSHWKDGMGEFEIWSAATLGDKYEQVVQEGDFGAPSGKNEQ